MGFVDFSGQGWVDGPIAGNNASEGGHRVTGECSLIGFNQVVIAAKPTCVVVLDYGYGGFCEVAGCAPGSFKVKEVVEGELRSANQLNRRHAQRLFDYSLLNIEGGFLVGIFSIAQVIELLHGYGHVLWESLFISEILGDGGVIHGDVLESFLSQPFPFFLVHLAQA